MALNNKVEVLYNPWLGGTLKTREHRNIFVCNNLEFNGTYYEAVKFFREMFPSKSIIFRSKSS